MTTATMYERAGGGAAIREAVDRFYRHLLADPDLAGYFAGDLTELKRHQAALLTQVLGGPSAYTGRDLAEAHAGLNISREHFQKVVFYLVGTLWELQVPMDITMAVGLTVSSLQSQVVAQPLAA
jgi:hemoglobin